MATIFKRKGTGPYIIQWFDHEGRRREKSSRTTDKRVAERIAAKLEADTALRRDGVIDARTASAAEQSLKTIDSHLADFNAKMVVENRDPKHIESTLKIIRAFSNASALVTVADITVDEASKYARNVANRGRSVRTVHAHLTALKSFTRWLARGGKLATDPLATLKKPNPKADRRVERRILLPAEFTWLRCATETGPTRFGTAGRGRGLLYTTAIQTGLRSSELRSLTRGRLFIERERDKPFIMCKARSTKNSKDAHQYITLDLAAELRTHIARKAPQAPVFTMPSKDDVADMLRADLAQARSEWLAEAKHDPEEYERRVDSDFLCPENHDREVLDFHALRHTTGAWAAMGGGHPKEIQVLMRHSSITLTMDTYGHLFPGQNAETVHRMPDMSGPDPEVLRATGTAGDTADPQQIPQQLQHEAMREHASLCDKPSDASASTHGRKAMTGNTVRDGMRDDATGSKNWPGRARTCNLLIQSQAFCQLNYGPRDGLMLSPVPGGVKGSRVQSPEFRVQS